MINDMKPVNIELSQINEVYGSVFDKDFFALKVAQTKDMKCISKIHEEKILEDGDISFCLNGEHLEITFEIMDSTEILNESKTLKKSSQ